MPRLLLIAVICGLVACAGETPRPEAPISKTAASKAVNQSSTSGPATEALPLNYTVDEGWLKLPPGQEVLGNSHGEVAVASNGEVYVSVNSEAGGLHIFGPDGAYRRRLSSLPWDSHDFLLHKATDGQEYLYGASVWGQKFYKATLDGETVMTITAEDVPAEYRKQDDGTLYMTMSGVAVAPDGDIYIGDGYGKDFIHQFTSDGAYVQTFGGRDDPWNFENCHKISVDPRFSPERLLCTDRVHGRLVHMKLDGEVIEEHATDLRRPSAVSFYGDLIAVAEISGRVSLLNREGQTLLTLGTNDVAEEVNTNETPPEKWRSGVFTSPHGIAFDEEGRLYISEWNKWGRVLRFSPD